MSVLLPGPYLFISEFLDHPDHIFKSALEHFLLSLQCQELSGRFNLGSLFVTHCLYLHGSKSSVYCQCSEECDGLRRRPVVPKGYVAFISSCK